MYSLLLLSSLLHITTCTVYIVTPDDHYYPNTTCHHCHNLQHYLLNVTKYFTSNTQLLFLPGLHHLHTDLIIQNVHNISLIGSTTNGTTLDTVIQLMHSEVNITIVNVSTLTIQNLMFEINTTELIVMILLNIKHCFSVSLNHLQFQPLQHFASFYRFMLKGLNIMGNSYFNHIVLPDESSVKLLYSENYLERGHQGHHVLAFNNCTLSALYIDMLQKSYTVTLRMANLQIEGIRDYFISARLGTNKVILSNCHFISNIYETYLFLFANGSVHFNNCHFINNADKYTNFFDLQPPWTWNNASISLIKVHSCISIELTNCNFLAKSLQTAGILQATNSDNAIYTVIIKNTCFTDYTIKKLYHRSHLTFSTNFFLLSHTTLILEDSVVFNNITTPSSIISLKGNSIIIITGSVEFSHNHACDLTNLYDNDRKYIIVKEHSVMNVNNNDVQSLFSTSPIIVKYPHPYCLFQYFSNSTNATVTLHNIKFLIKFKFNHCKKDLKLGCYDYIPVIHCLWLPQSFLNNTIPLEVNSKYIQFINNSGTYKLSQVIEQSSLCVCTDELHYDCHINDLGYLYPGQTLTVSLYNHKVTNNTINAVVVKTDINQQYVTPCIVLDISENLQLIENKCTKLNYTIGFPTDSWCELFLKLASDSDDNLNIFYIWQLACPTGFVKIDKRCRCDPVLVQYGITNCNINDQTILRPANSWISATTHKNSCTYHISLHCPFHYCLPHSSHLNLSTPNSQCQFNRFGLLCGHCQQGLSTVFSSPHCQHCSNIYLLLIIPIAIAGLVLVLLLFFLNLTVTDGTINGFILYVNIISVNTPVFFNELNHFTPTYTFISLANLDLGIQTCFYNGMDDYAKMWLQLAFPFYLIFIATSIIITSRYSTTIQRLTARRALPVLATLFLLSYTKILRIVTSVLFFYSTITHLPSKHPTLVWSVDANVPLFGVRFTILFIVCLILFLILVPFNVILLFTRTLSRFRLINKFKPLLDAYQGPYKDKFYNWTGLQLLIRVVFFGISSLDNNVNLTVSIILFSIVGVVHGIICPLKAKYKNHQELALILNLHGLYTISLYSQDINMVVSNVITAMAAVQFTLIIIYHVVTYVHGGVIRNKIQLSLNSFTRWVSRLHIKSQHRQFHLPDNTCNNIPEVTFNYHEHREPLIGQEYNSYVM